ncbi:Gfo/Idh/MocA family oxidoreductase [Alicyclobacillus herbarius]|uniref:Gfo/Idh/MocA family oxidoreductase n=2 Tax=Alicyclobacillus herbarius TaxID=122960 RepID=UPI00047EC9DF|nr:Gfo/Idh/MocA family oxidoreductase [Alicyclobacillus herbarius]
MLRRVRVGIAGLGTATRQMLPAILRHPMVELSAAASIHEEERSAFSRDFKVPTYHDIGQLCERPDIDAVYISTPSHLHKDHVLIALRYGKHVLVEKPLTTELEAGLAVASAADESGCVVLVGHSHSYDPPIQAMRDVIQSGRLGPLRMVHTWCYNDWLYRPRLDEELDTAQGGGVTMRQGAHQFDILRYLAGGRVRSVRAQVGRWDSSRPTEGAHVVFLEFENGVAATAVYNGYDHFHTSALTFDLGEWGHPVPRHVYGERRRQIRAIGRKEEIHLKRNQAGYRSREDLPSPGEHQPFFGITLVSCERGDILQSPNGLLIYGEEGVEEVTLPADTPHERVIDEWINAILGIAKPVHTHAWGLATLEVCLAVLESAGRRKEVILRHQVDVQA